jgi:hypothetical protein
MGAIIATLVAEILKWIFASIILTTKSIVVSNFRKTIFSTAALLVKVDATVANEKITQKDRNVRLLIE